MEELEHQTAKLPVEPPGVVTGVLSDFATESDNKFLESTVDPIPATTVVIAAFLMKFRLFADSIVDSGQIVALFFS